MVAKIPAAGVDLDGAITVNESSADKDFRVESNGNTHMLFVDGGSDKVGIGETTIADLDATLHIKTADSGGSFHSEGDELGVENSGHAGISILSGTSSNGALLFGDSGDNNIGRIVYGHSNNDMQFFTNASESVRIDSTGRLTLGGFADDAGFKGRIRTRSDANDNYICYFTNSGDSTPYGGQVQFSGATPDDNTRTFFNYTDGTVRCTIYSDGDIKNHDNSYGSLSDERIKQDIRDSNSQWDDIKAVKVRNFKKKDDVRQYGNKAWEQIGVVAQELEAVSPKLIRHNDPSSADIVSDSSFGTLWTKDDSETQDAVLYTADDQEVINGDKKVGDIKTPSTKQIGDVKEVKEQVKSVNYSVLYMKAIKALQECMARIEALESK